MINKKIINIPALVLMTKWPAIKRCKTRLAREIGYKNAVLIQEKLIDHTFKVASKLEEMNLVETSIAISGITPRSAQRWSIRKGIKSIRTQGRGNLGLKMRRQFIKIQTRNQKRNTLIIGTDLPSLSLRDLMEALEELKSNQMVLGPSKDGGYWLIGLSGKLINPVVSWPFVGIPWGTNMVLEKTLLLAKANNIKCSLLHKHNDIDLLKDLSPWQG